VAAVTGRNTLAAKNIQQMHRTYKKLQTSFEVLWLPLRLIIRVRVNDFAVAVCLTA